MEKHKTSLYNQISIFKFLVHKKLHYSKRSCCQTKFLHKIILFFDTPKDNRNCKQFNNSHEVYQSSITSRHIFISYRSLLEPIRAPLNLLFIFPLVVIPVDLSCRNTGELPQPTRRRSFSCFLFCFFPFISPFLCKDYLSYQRTLIVIQMLK